MTIHCVLYFGDPTWLAHHNILNLVFSAIADTVFFAAINQFEFPVSDEEVIVWNTAVINPGGHYDSVTGAYTAPLHGYYHFTVQKESNSGQAKFRIYKEGEEVLYNGGYGGSADPTPVATSSFILELKARERVQIYNLGSTVIYGGDPGYRSWFSGFLLYAL